MSEKILLVEDDDKIRGIVIEYFTAKSEGRFEVIEASTGEEGMELIEKENFDIVLLDVMLPGIDGFTLCRRIRKSKDVPILFLTAKTSEEDRLYGYEIGCDDYICKPVSFVELYAKVNAVGTCSYRSREALRRPHRSHYLQDIIHNYKFII